MHLHKRTSKRKPWVRRGVKKEKVKEQSLEEISEVEEGNKELT